MLQAEYGNLTFPKDFFEIWEISPKIKILIFATLLDDSSGWSGEAERCNNDGREPIWHKNFWNSSNLYYRFE